MGSQAKPEVDSPSTSDARYVRDIEIDIGKVLSKPTEAAAGSDVP